MGGNGIEVAARRWVPLAVAAGVVVLTAGIAAMAVLNQGGAPPAAGPDDDQVVRDGDRVTATGVLLQEGDQLRLCELGPAILPDPGPPPSCARGVMVEAGVAVPASVRWQETSGVRHSEAQYTITGVWRDGGIADASLAPASTGSDDSLGEQPPAEELPLPCDAPPDGWKAPRAEPDRIEAARQALNAQVDGHPASYSGMWLARAGGEVEVMVVGTVHDPAEHQAKLAKAYPYPLCVTKVDFSAAQLDAVARRLSGAGSWETAVLPHVARVEVRLTVLDQAAQDWIGTSADMVTVVPFVRKI